MHRGLKAFFAMENGLEGLIMYSDPLDDGDLVGTVYPEGEWRPDFSSQRGSARFINLYSGDPTTPGVWSTFVKLCVLSAFYQRFSFFRFVVTSPSHLAVRCLASIFLTSIQTSEPSSSDQRPRFPIFKGLLCVYGIVIRGKEERPRIPPTPHHTHSSTERKRKISSK